MNRLYCWKTRAAALFAVAFALALSAVTTVLAQHMPVMPLNPIEAEHRLTSVETRIDRIAQDIEEIKLHAWLNLAGLGGLVAEAGRRAIGERKKVSGD